MSTEDTLNLKWIARYEELRQKVNMMTAVSQLVEEVKAECSLPEWESGTAIREGEGVKAGDRWFEYIKQFPVLVSFFQSIGEVSALWLAQQIDIFAEKYPQQKSVSEINKLLDSMMLKGGNSDTEKLKWLLHNLKNIDHGN